MDRPRVEGSPGPPNPMERRQIRALCARREHGPGLPAAYGRPPACVLVRLWDNQRRGHVPAPAGPRSATGVFVIDSDGSYMGTAVPETVRVARDTVWLPANVKAHRHGESRPW